jgi:hypothetical protein
MDGAPITGALDASNYLWPQPFYYGKAGADAAAEGTAGGTGSARP